MLRLLLKHASRLVFCICRKSSWRFSSIVSKRAKSASMAGHNPAPSPQIFFSHSSTTFFWSSVILFFLRLKKFWQNFKSLSALLRLLLKHASRLVFCISRKSSWRFSSIVSKRAKSASMAGHNPAPSPQIFFSHSSTTFFWSSVILFFLRLKKFWQNFKSLSALLRLLLKHASRLVFCISRKSSWRFSSIVSKRAKSASMAGHNPAPSPQIFFFHSSTTFFWSSVILFFLRLKKFWQNFKSLSALLRLLLKHASRLGFLICFSSSSRLANMASNRAKSMSSASLQSLRSQSIRVAFWSAVTDFSILL